MLLQGDRAGWRSELARMLGLATRTNPAARCIWLAQICGMNAILSDRSYGAADERRAQWAKDTFWQAMTADRW